MSQDKEIECWILQREWHEQDWSFKRGRYRAEVRHPLKARRLDEPLKFQFRTNRKPVPLPPVKLPEAAKCAKCGEVVSMGDSSHGCFTGFTWKGRR